MSHIQSRPPSCDLAGVCVCGCGGGGGLRAVVGLLPTQGLGSRTPHNGSSLSNDIDAKTAGILPSFPPKENYLSPAPPGDQTHVFLSGKNSDVRLTTVHSTTSPPAPPYFLPPGVGGPLCVPDHGNSQACCSSCNILYPRCKKKEKKNLS